MNRAYSNSNTKANAYKSKYHLTKTYNYKQKKKLLVLSIVLFFVFTNQANARYPENRVEFNYFHQTLAPHGEWIELEYDLYVWRPNRVSRNWSPYSEGRWVWSSNGWYWDSYEPFGWATYHYGRWYYDNFYGWVWSPGYEWAPAWVEWRYDDNYVGWAPLPPYAHFRIDSGIHFSITWHSPYSRWRFVNYNRFTDLHIGSHYIESYKVKNFFGRTKYLTNYHYEGRRIVNRGIRRSDIEKRGRIKIRKTEMRDVTSIRRRNSDDIDRSSIKVFRPSEIRTEYSRNERNNSVSNNSDRFLQREKAERTGVRDNKSKKKEQNRETIYKKRIYKNWSDTKSEIGFSTGKSERVKRNKHHETSNEKSFICRVPRYNNSRNEEVKKSSTSSRIESTTSTKRRDR